MFRNKNKMKVLLIDDSPEDIQALRNLISADDIDVHSFLHFEDAKSSFTVNDYGLAILDMQMPGIDDNELIKFIGEIKSHAHIPIIFITDQQNNAQTVLQGYETGAIDLLFKPLNPYIVRSKVRVFVEMQGQRHIMQAQLKELERLRTAAEAATVAKSQFLANMSHEIRTPLAAVMGFADLIARGEVPAREMDECASSVRRNGNLLLRLIDDILDLSKIEANHLDMDMQTFSMMEILEDIESTLSLKAHEKGLQLYFNKMACNRHQIHIFDPIRMKQILLNIIGNAVKFTPRGEVLVSVALDPMTEGKDRLTVTVKNEGVGFGPEQASRLFQPFGQADASVKREFGGSGLGLVISRQLARAMGGDVILVKSEVGVVTIFQITVELERAKRSLNEVQSLRKSDIEIELFKKVYPDKHILIVDDVRDNLVLLEMFLRGTKSKLTLASNGIEALELCKKNTFDMIFMDVQMPKMGGHEATELIRKLGLTLPIIALTAHASKTEYDKCLEAGCDDAIVKPFTKNSIIKILAHYFEGPLPL